MELGVLAVAETATVDLTCVAYLKHPNLQCASMPICIICYYMLFLVLINLSIYIAKHIYVCMYACMIG